MTFVKTWHARGFEPDPDELVNQDAAIPDGDYYVTARYNSRTAWLLGPYTDYLEVLANIARGRRLVTDNAGMFGDRERLLIPWLGWGHARVPVGDPSIKTLFGA